MAASGYSMRSFLDEDTRKDFLYTFLLTNRDLDAGPKDEGVLRKVTKTTLFSNALVSKLLRRLALLIDTPAVAQNIQRKINDQKEDGFRYPIETPHKHLKKVKKESKAQYSSYFD